jgi:hypothetical protein
MARLGEPSTYAALSGLLGAIGLTVGQSTLAAIGAGISALLGIVLKEKS